MTATLTDYMYKHQCCLVRCCLFEGTALVGSSPTSKDYYRLIIRNNIKNCTVCGGWYVYDVDMSMYISQGIPEGRGLII